MRNKRLIIIFSILLSLTLLVAIGSAVFSVKTVNAYCYNADDKELEDQVLSRQDDLLGRSIFSINEKKLIASVEERVAGIKVVNIERLFPNRVSINYIKLYQYFETMYDGGYYTFGVDGKVLKKDTMSGTNSIKVKFDFTKPISVGESLSDVKGFDALVEMVDILERLDYRGTDMTVMIQSIDFAFSEYTIYIKMRSGVLIELIGDYKADYANAGSKLHKALSQYMSNERFRAKGTIRVTDADEFTYTEEIDSKYEESNL